MKPKQAKPSIQTNQPPPSPSMNVVFCYALALKTHYSTGMFWQQRFPLFRDRKLIFSNLHMLWEKEIFHKLLNITKGCFISLCFLRRHIKCIYRILFSMLSHDCSPVSSLFFSYSVKDAMQIKVVIRLCGLEVGNYTGGRWLTSESKT